MNSLMGGLFPGGGIGLRAEGGPVIGGQPYIVGEEGPERKSTPNSEAQPAE